MPDIKIAAVYFSATNVTKTYAEVIEEELIKKGCKVDLYNITSFPSRQETIPFDNYTGIIFGFPVFGDLAPAVINEWLPMLKGNGKKCVTYFTYGARTTGYAHFYTKSLLEEAGFKVQFTAEFLGRHSINLAGWNILPERPDESDFKIAREFAGLAVDNFSTEAGTSFNLQKPFGFMQFDEARKNQKKSPERMPNQPVRVQQDCSMCRKCETECPAQAFNADTGLPDPLKCISCFHCVYVCPDKVVKVSNKMKDFYPIFLKQWNLTEEMMEQKKSKIITHFLDAAC